MSNSRRKHDPEDVLRVGALELVLRDLMDEVAQARSALARLDAAGYAGADVTRDYLEDYVGPRANSMRAARLALKRFRRGRGRNGAYWYHALTPGMTADQAVQHMIEVGGDPPERIEAVRTYAAHFAGRKR